MFHMKNDDKKYIERECVVENIPNVRDIILNTTRHTNIITQCLCALVKYFISNFILNRLL
jgi:hypothetical protein